MTNVVIILGGLVLLGGLLAAEKRQDRKLILLTKTPLSVLFVVTALVQPRVVPEYFGFVLAGLSLCLVGDVCLALPRDKAFLAGLAAFLLGHVSYIFGFASLSLLRQWLSLGAVVFVLFSATVFFWLRPHLKKMLLWVLAYIVVITVMVSGAWAVWQRSGCAPAGKAFVYLGAFCFYLSDVFVARDRFVRPEFLNRLIGLPLYYLGQFLLAFSVGLLI